MTFETTGKNKDAGEVRFMRKEKFEDVVLVGAEGSTTQVDDDGGMKRREG